MKQAITNVNNQYGIDRNYKLKLDAAIARFSKFGDLVESLKKGEGVVFNG